MAYESPMASGTRSRLRTNGVAASKYPREIANTSQVLAKSLIRTAALWLETRGQSKSGSLVIPVKSISMINQVNKEYPSMLVILLLSGYYNIF